MLAEFSAFRKRSLNRAFASIKSRENGTSVAPLPNAPKPPVGPQKKMKEIRNYFGKPNIQKKTTLQEYLHKKNTPFPEILGELGIKKSPDLNSSFL